MGRVATIPCLMVGLALLGCQPADRSAEQAAAPSEIGVSEVPLSEAEPELAPAPPKYSAQQVAEARKLAEQLNARITEDAAGNVTGLDMAAGRSWVDDAQMRQILVFEKLQSLTLEGPSITDDLVPRIAELGNLTSLALRNTLISDTGIAQLTGLRAMRVIDLRVAPMVTDAAMQSLAQMSELRAVRLMGGNVTDAGVATLLALPRLTELDVRNCRRVTKAGLEPLIGKESLRVLKIGGPNIGDDVLELVGRMEQLTSLAIGNAAVTDTGMMRLTRLSLENLSVYQCANLTDEGLAVLADFPNLRVLELRDVAATGAGLTQLPSPEKLISLSLAQSRLTDAEIPHLARLTGLANLNLGQTAITDAAVDTLAALPSLKRLIVTQTQLSENGVARLRKALPHCTIEAS